MRGERCERRCRKAEELPAQNHGFLPTHQLYLLIMAARGRIREIYELSHNCFDYWTRGGCQL